MKLYELGRYNIPGKIIDARIDWIGEAPLPVQQRALQGSSVLEGNTLIICSLTSSEKTSVGDFAAVKGAEGENLARLRRSNATDTGISRQIHLVSKHPKII